MSVATANRFAFLDEDDSSNDVAPTPAPAPKSATPAEAPRTTRGRGGNTNNTSSRRGTYYKRGGGNPNTAIPTTDADGFTSGTPNDLGARQNRTEGRPEGRGRGRGGRGGRGGRDDRRAFDKHSQTGQVDTEKQINAGWGADTGAAELIAEAAGEADAAAEGAAAETTAETPAAEGEAKKDGDATPARKSRREEEEEEDNTLTLDEYLAQKKASDAVPKLEGSARQVDAEFKDAVLVTKDEADDVYFAGKTKAPPKARAKKEEKVVIEIDARFERPQRDGARGGRGGDRGGRGRGERGGRGRGGPRGGAGERPTGGRNTARAVDVDDEKAFPSLGA